MSVENRIPWADLIGSLGKVRQELSRLQPDVFPMSVPNLGVGARDLELLERDLGYSLDRQYRELLFRINGWSNFFSDISILGLSDLRPGPAWARACQLVTLYYEYVEEADPRLPAMGELFPVAISSHQRDVLAIVRTGPTTNGGCPVLWLADDVVEEFDNVEQMLLFFYQKMLRLAEVGSNPID